MMDGHVHLAEALLAIAVHVFGGGIAGLLRGLDESVEQGVVLVTGMDPERPAVAPIGVAALLAMLGPPEVGQDLLVRPALAILLERPAVVVQSVAADIDHGVERRRTAQHAPARPVHDTVVHIGLRLGVVVPVVPGVHQVVHQRGRHVDLPVPPRIARPGFQQAHLVAGILAQAVREHAPGGPAADDQVIVYAVELHALVPFCSDTAPRSHISLPRAGGGKGGGAGSARLSLRAREQPPSPTLPQLGANLGEGEDNGGVSCFHPHASMRCRHGQLFHGVSPILMFRRWVMRSMAARRASAPLGPSGLKAARSHMPSIRQARSCATFCTSGSRTNGRSACTRLLCRRRMMTVWMRARRGLVGTCDQKASQALTAAAVNSSGPRLPSTTAIRRCAAVLAACWRRTTEALRLTASWRMVASSSSPLSSK